MNVKGNQLAMRTEKKLESAFRSLLETKEIRQITVSEICREAGVNRTTFYSHYQDVDDLMSRLVGKFYEELVSGFAKEGGFLTPDGFAHLFELVRENQVLFRTSHRHPEAVMKDILFISRDQKVRLKQALEKRNIPDSPQLYYHQSYFIGGLIVLISVWLEQGCDLSDDRMAQIALDEYRKQAKLALPDHV